MASKRAATPPPFATLPNAVLFDPPLGAGGFTPFQMAVAAALVGLARAQRPETVHATALAGGTFAMATARERGERFRAAADEVGMKALNQKLKIDGAVETPDGQYVTRADRKAAKKGAVPRAGKRGYADAVKAARAKAKPITMRVTRRALLIAAGIAPTWKPNYAHLEDALDRLRRPVQVGGKSFAPVLAGAEMPASGAMTLTVAAEWLPANAFAAVPLPLPRKGAAQCALYLHLHVLPLGANARPTTRAALYRKLGVAERWPSEAANQLAGALASVNAHLAGLDRAALEKALRKNRPPPRFTLHAVGADRVRFGASFNQEDQMGADDLSPVERALEAHLEEQEEQNGGLPEPRPAQIAVAGSSPARRLLVGSAAAVLGAERGLSPEEIAELESDPEALAEAERELAERELVGRRIDDYAARRVNWLAAAE